MNRGRFDYIKYDEASQKAQSELKKAFVSLEELIMNKTTSGRASAMAMTCLEEAYMWCGKAVRDDQIKRQFIDGTTPILEEERSDS